MPSIDEEIRAVDEEIEALRRQLSELRRKRPPERVSDYRLHGAGGVSIKLSDLFGGKRELIVIHNMGKTCAYCTLWADGLAGALDHIKSRASLVVVSPDPPEVQEDFAKRRNWPFRMVSAQASDFTRDMGFADGEQMLPGVSAFYLGDDGQIFRANKDEFGPGDPYSAVWHLFDLLKDGPAGWQPRFSYG